MIPFSHIFYHTLYSYSESIAEREKSNPKKIAPKAPWLCSTEKQRWKYHVTAKYTNTMHTIHNTRRISKWNILSFPNNVPVSEDSTRKKLKCTDLASWQSTVDPGAEWPKPGVDIHQPDQPLSLKSPHQVLSSLPSTHTFSHFPFTTHSTPSKTLRAAPANALLV